MSSQREIAGIQYLRGIAACAVVFDHASAMASFEKYFGETLLNGWLHRGALGVDLFFMISGFIISIVSLRRNDAEPTVSRLEFARRRAFRILPMMWIAILSYGFFRAVSGVEADVWSYARAMTVWPIGDLEPNHIWTLRHEAIFYVLFAATFLTSRWLRPLVLVWALSPFAYALAGLETDPSDMGLQLLRTLSHPANVEFGFGLLFGLLWTKGLHRLSFKAPHLFATAVLYFIAVVAVGNLLGLRIDRVPDTLISALLFSPLIAMGIWGAGSAHPIGLILGNASFSIYLFHPHVVSGALRVWSTMLPDTPVMIVVPAIAVIAILFGVGVHLSIEEPLRKGLEGGWRRRGVISPK